MKRREAIASLALLAGGMWITKSCSFDSNGASIALKNYKMTKSSEELLSTVVRSILPLDGSEPDEIKNLHLFVMKMVDDCNNTQEQEQFVAGLKQLENGNWDAKIKTDFSPVPFGKATAEERTAMVNCLNKADDSDLKTCYEIIKRRTIQGFNNSEYLMKGKGTYELVPGRYNGYSKV